MTARILVAALGALLMSAVWGQENSVPLGTHPWNPRLERTLDAGEVSVFKVELHEGFEYVITGWCSADCDLAVLDPGGDTVGTDYEADSFPVVEVAAEQSGYFRVELSCPAEDCTARVDTEETRSGTLPKGGVATIPIHLETGAEYTLTGVCDSDCSDLDFRLRDPEGEQVGEDTLTDSVPVLVFEPREDGVFSLVVEMIECSVEPCHWQVRASADPRE